jgi:hypothetical protein
VPRVCHRPSSVSPFASCGGKSAVVTCEMHLIPDNFKQRWNGMFFDRDSLKNLGLCYQLGHAGDSCPLPQPGPKTFIVFDTSGPHLITINYCNCHDQPLPNHTQLLREKWFPATLTRPQTVFTFDCLETFHELTLQGKTNLYDYYNTLLRRYDNAGVSNPIVSLLIFLFFWVLIPS